MKVILTTPCNSGFLHWLLAMLESLGDRLEQHSLGVFDIGLTEEDRDKIRKLKPDVIFKKPEDSADVPEACTNIRALANLYQPYACNVFPNYDAYMHVDSDLWFADPSAIDDMIEAGQKHGVACVNERKLFFTTRKKFLGLTVFKHKEAVVYAIIKEKFGEAEAKRLAHKGKQRMNGGFSYIQGGHNFWQLYQASAEQSLRHLFETRNEEVDFFYNFSDQACFLHALLDSEMAHEVLPYTHNCIEKKLTFDKTTGELFYPYSPDEPVKVVHLTGEGKDRIRKLKTTDRGYIKTPLTYHAIQELKRELKKV